MILPSDGLFQKKKTTPWRVLFVGPSVSPSMFQALAKRLQSPGLLRLDLKSDLWLGICIKDAMTALHGSLRKVNCLFAFNKMQRTC